MKKIIPFAALLILLQSCQSTPEPHQMGNLVPYFFEDSIGAEETPLLTNEQKLWLLALPAVITEANNSASHTLEFERIDNASQDRWQELLSSSWRIRNREELLNTISRLEYKGDRSICLSLLDIKENPDPRIQLSANRMRSLQFLENNYSIYKAVDLEAWDLGRITLLIRWGYHVGYLSEEESWNMLLYFGWKIKQNYDSWDEFGSAFRLGRIFWASGLSREEKYRESTDTVMHELYSRSGLWRRVKWIKELPAYSK